MSYPTPPADLPTPIESDVRMKVIIHYYQTEAEAKKAGKWFDELGAYRSSLGYDSGYWGIGYQGKTESGLFRAVEL